jgi:hypothetical protein
LTTLNANNNLFKNKTTKIEAKSKINTGLKSYFDISDCSYFYFNHLKKKLLKISKRKCQFKQKFD